MAILTAILTFLSSALALKLALSVMGQPHNRNSYSTAVSVSALLTLTGWAFGFVPFIGWLLNAVLWCVVVRSTYEISLKRSLGVAVLLVVIRAALSWVLGAII